MRIESNGRATLLLDGVDVTLVPGELVALIGPNGSGKSTLIRSLSRILKPHSGVVRLGDMDLYTGMDARSAARHIGVVPQDTQIAFDFTVREVVSMGRAPYRPRLSLLSGETSDDHEIVDRSLTYAGISLEMSDRPISSLSGGERQRVLVARALAQEATVLLLDEPTASLDIRHEGRLLAWLHDLANGEKRTVMIVIHDLNIAAQHADRVILLDNGKVVAQGSPAETLTAERIRDVYGTAVWVRKHPVTGRPLLLNLPLSGIDNDEPSFCRGTRIHLLGGGGSAAPLMMQLAAAGARITLGALNLGDTDQEAATLLGIPHPVASPFTSLPTDLVDAGIEFGKDADAVVLCETPFGDGNLGTLVAAGRLALLGVPTILVSDCPTLSRERDFSFKQVASRRWAQMTEYNNVVITSDPISMLAILLNKCDNGVGGADSDDAEGD